MTSNLLSHINTILEATGTVPYSIDKLTINDVLSMRDYAIGVEHLVNSLTLLSNHPNKIAYLEADSEEYTNILYRASSSKGYNPFLLTPGERVAQGVSNISTRLISDILPSWRNLPKRNRSIICSNNFFVAANYMGYGGREKGVVYVVIPPNDAQLVVSPTKDIWDAFKNLESLPIVDESIATFLAFFYHIFDKKLLDTSTTPPSIDTSLLFNREDDKVIYIDIVREMFLKHDVSKLLNFINKVDQLLSINDNGDDDDDDDEDEFLETLLSIYKKYADDYQLFKLGKYIIDQKMSNRNISIIDILDKLFDPKANGFSIMKYSEFAKNARNKKREVWTDAPCIFIKSTDANFLTELYYQHTEVNKGV